MSIAGYPEQVAAPGPGRALVPFVSRRTRPFGPLWKAALLVAVLGLAAGLGGAAAYGLRQRLVWTDTREPATTAAVLAQLQDQVAQLRHGIDALSGVADTARADTARANDGVRALKRGLDTLKQDIEQARAGSAASVAALSAKIDRVDHDPSPKLADIALRLDRIEKQAAASAPGPASTPAAPLRSTQVPVSVPKPVAAVPSTTRGGVTQVTIAPGNALPDKPATVGGWVLRDVYDGMALVEARGGGLREVEPGEYLPGAGQVRSIERRGRGWVVMTSRGVIDKATF